MKISSVIGSKHYRNDCNNINVFLNSVEMDDCIYADTKNGIIKTLVYGKDNAMPLITKKGKYKTNKILGNVTLIDKTNLKNIKAVIIGSTGFAAEGNVINVYDTNAHGQKVIVEFEVGSVNNTYWLINSPYGEITCDVEL